MNARSTRTLNWRARRLHAARRQLHVLGPQRVLHVRHRDPAGGQGVAVDPDAHREGLVAADAHPRHPVEHREAIDQVAAGIVGELGDGHAVAHQIEPHDHVFVAVHLLDVGRIRLHRELVQYPGDAVADVVGGAVDVPVDGELDGDGRASVLAHGLDGVDALHPRDPVLDELGDARLHHVGGGARVDGLDGDDGRVDVRVFPQRQTVEGDQSEGDQQQRQDRREDRPGDREVREDHWPVSSISRRPREPSSTA